MWLLVEEFFACNVFPTVEIFGNDGFGDLQGPTLAEAQKDGEATLSLVVEVVACLPCLMDF
jgi:hypothetical protein